MNRRASCSRLAVAALIAACLTARTAHAQALVVTTGSLSDACTNPAESNCSSGVLYLVNGDTLQVQSSVDLWRGLRDVISRKIVVDPGGTLAYVAQSARAFPPTSFWIDVIDLRTMTKLKTFGNLSGDLRTISADGRRLYLVAPGAVQIMDSATGAIISEFAAAAPNDVAVSSSGARIYVSGGAFGGFGILVTDATGATVAKIPLQYAGQIGLTPDESHLFALSPGSRLYDIHTASNTVVREIKEFGGPTNPNQFTFAHGRVYLSVSFQTPGVTVGEIISAIDIATGTVVGAVGVLDPVYVGASADGTRVFTHTLGEPRTITIDTATNKIIGRVTTPGGPGPFAAVPTKRIAAVIVDAPSAASSVQEPFDISGWAVDVQGLLPGPGIDTVHVWAFPSNGSAPSFVGADYGRARPDVGALFGPSFTNSGYRVTVRGLPPGSYELRAFGRSTRTGEFSVVRTVPVTIRSSARLVVDTPASNRSVPAQFRIAGWALEGAATSGTGIDAVHVWAYSDSGGPAVFAGAATLGDPRPDVAAFFGAPFVNSGYHLDVSNLPPGDYLLVVYGRSTVTGTFSVEQYLRLTLNAPQPLMFIDVPAPQASVAGNFTVAGWAVESGAPSGTGVDVIQVWATPAVPPGPAIFLGTATYGTSRPDIGAWLGPQYTPSGFTLNATLLKPGVYHLSVYARSTTTGTFRNVRVVTVILPPPPPPASRSRRR